MNGQNTLSDLFEDGSRGVGTCSVRLLTENYLRGYVDCSSHEVAGTMFRVRVPVSG